MKKHVTAFYVETLVLILAFLAVILMLTRVFGLARAESVEAGWLTEAVHLAERAAEAVAASDSLEDVQKFLGEGGNAVLTDDTLEMEIGDLTEADLMEGKASENGFLMYVTWEKDGGSLIRSHIRVCRDGKEIYSLETATRAALGEEAAQ